MEADCWFWAEEAKATMLIVALPVEAMAVGYWFWVEEVKVLTSTVALPVGGMVEDCYFWVEVEGVPRRHAEGGLEGY